MAAAALLSRRRIQASEDPGFNGDIPEGSAPMAEFQYIAVHRICRQEQHATNAEWEASGRLPCSLFPRIDDNGSRFQALK